MGSIISSIDDKVKEMGSLEAYRDSLIPVCKAHNYKGWLCLSCYGERQQAWSKLLTDILYALSQLPNNPLEGNYRDTHAVRDAIEKTLKNEDT